MTPRDRLPWKSWLIWPAVAYLAAFGLVEISGLDLRLASCFFDPVSGTFPRRNDVWFRDIAHDLGRDGVVCAGVVALGCLALGAVDRKGARAAAKADLRRAATFVVLGLLLGSGQIAALKQVTNVDCPWDVDLFGGDRPYVPLLETRPPELPPGKCFPGGHSSGAFGFFGLYFVTRERYPKSAALVLARVVISGVFYSAVQWARGAHFVSHDLTSALICWSTVVLLYVGPFRGRLLRAGIPVEVTKP